VAVRDLTVTQDGLIFRARGGTDDLYSIWAAREGAIADCLRRLLKPGDVFVDAGANMGLFTVIAARLVGPAGRVYAFEMMADTAASLRRNVDLNGATNVVVIERALSDTAGRTIRATVPGVQWGAASIARVYDGAAQDVETTTLDHALSEISYVCLIKMDLEGAELAALRGAAMTLMRTGAVIFERQRDRGADETLEAFLRAQGMTVRALDKSNGFAAR